MNQHQHAAARANEANMIAFTSSFDLTFIDAIAGQLEGYSVATIMERVVSKREPSFKATMQAAEPGKVKYPIQWTSERQRRAYFATNGFGNGIPYRRTGGLSRAWFIESSGDADAATVRVGNKKRMMKYVYGSLAQNRANRLQFQQRFHRNTGWPDAYGKYVGTEVETLQSEFERESRAWFTEATGGKGFAFKRGNT